MEVPTNRHGVMNYEAQHEPNALSCPHGRSPVLAGLDLREGDYAHLLIKWLSFRIARHPIAALHVEFASC
jgi:hypothetical protein